MMVRKAGKSRPQGSRRFRMRANDEVVGIDKKVGENTYELRPLIRGTKSFLDRATNRYSAERLVKVDLPAIQLDSQGRELEYTVEGYSWGKAKVLEMAPDGRVKLEPDHNRHETKWVDLSKLRYRWLC